MPHVRYPRGKAAMDVHIRRFNFATAGVVFAPAVGLTALSYTNGYSVVTAAAVGAATAAVAIWAIVWER